MCLILHKPAGARVPAQYLDNAATHNPDGWGVMWARDGKIKCARSMKERAYHHVLGQIGERPCTVHFRFGTHGSKSIDNCHPFLFADSRYALMHNGILDNVSCVDVGRSDTYHFAHMVLEPILRAAPTLFDSPEFPIMLAQMIGDDNKLVILRADGAQVTVNESEGTWDPTGLWLSNTYSIAPKHTFGFSTGKRWSEEEELEFQEWARKSPWRDYERTEPIPLEGSGAFDDDERDAPTLVIPRDPWECIGMERDDLIDLMSAAPDDMADLMIEALDWLTKAYN